MRTNELTMQSMFKFFQINLNHKGIIIFYLYDPTIQEEGKMNGLANIGGKSGWKK